MPFDNKNSGQAIAAVIAEKANPVADVLYLGGQVGIQAKEQGLTQAYKPKGFDELPADLKDADGYWFTIHSGTLGFMVNKDALGAQARAAVLEGPVEARVQGHGSGIWTRPAPPWDSSAPPR